MDHFEEIFKTNFGEAWLPAGYTSREIVMKAIAFDNPPRVPYMFNTHPNDFFQMINFNGLTTEKPKTLKARYDDSWGVTWEVTGRGWDRACGHPLADLSRLSTYHFPNLGYDVVNEQLKQFIQIGKTSQKYIMGINSINMFELMRSLMGFEELMMAPYLQPEGLNALLERLVELTCQLVDNYQMSGGIDGFITYEDMGLQTGLQMNIEHFRKYYKPHYRKIIEYCHQRSVHFIWHSCGDIITLIPEMADLGVDVVQLDQPRLMGYENLIKASGGKLCFFNGIDNQWSARPEVTIEEVVAETERMLSVYSSLLPNGGLMIKHYTQPWDIDLPREKELAIAETFFKCQQANAPVK